MDEAAVLVRALRLAPHPREGGFYRETWRSGSVVATPAGARSLGTAILYLLAPGCFSALHRLPGEEIWHFHRGDPVEMLLLGPRGAVEEPVLGPDVAAGQRVQVVVPGGTWLGGGVGFGGRSALVGTTTARGFAFADWAGGDGAELSAAWPAAADRIRGLALPPGGAR